MLIRNNFVIYSMIEQYYLQP